MKLYFRTDDKTRRLWWALILLTTVLACNFGSQSSSPKLLTETEYKKACKLTAVDQLTKNADSKKGELVQLTGQILVFEETVDGEETATRLIIAVEDETNTLPSGQLPVYIMYQGRISQFINDTVTIYGEVYGNDVYKSTQIQEKTLPRVDAMYIEAP